MSKTAREVLTAYYDAEYQHGAEDFANGIISLLDGSGFVIVPKEPSEEMIKYGALAAIRYISDQNSDGSALARVKLTDDEVADTYCAMLLSSKG